MVGRDLLQGLSNGWIGGGWGDGRTYLLGLQERRSEQECQQEAAERSKGAGCDGHDDRPFVETRVLEKS